MMDHGVRVRCSSPLANHEAFDIDMQPERISVTPPELTSSWRKAFGENLRKHREARGLSARQLAVEAKMYWIELERYEDASQIPTLDRVYALAACLDVSVHDLLPARA